MDPPEGYGVLTVHMGPNGWEVDDFPERLLIDAYFLESGAADPNTVERSGDTVTFRAANGWATYALTANPFTYRYEAERVARGV